MGQKKSIKVHGEPLQIDPQLLFQHLTTVAQNMTGNVVELFQYELCSQLASLFDQHGLLREANKAQFADDIWPVVKGNEMQPPEIAGKMNQRIPWKRDETFNSIAKAMKSTSNKSSQTLFLCLTDIMLAQGLKILHTFVTPKAW